MSRVVVISGYFNPLHCGHLDYIEGAAKLGDKLVVIINSDEQVKLKGSVSFMEESERVRIIAALGMVDHACLSTDKDESVTKTLEGIYNYYATDYFFDGMIFANGGDRTETDSPEEAYCQWRKIKTAYNVGGGKTNSSSELLKKIEN